MATLIENKNRIINSFDSIRSAIISKGQNPTSVSEYPSAIASIQPGADNLLLMGSALHTNNISYGTNQYRAITSFITPSEYFEKYFELDGTYWVAKKNCCLLSIGMAMGRFSTTATISGLQIARVGAGSYTQIEGNTLGIRLSQGEVIQFLFRYSNSVRNRTYTCYENINIYVGD